LFTNGIDSFHAEMRRRDLSHRGDGNTYTGRIAYPGGRLIHTYTTEPVMKGFGSKKTGRPIGP